MMDEATKNEIVMLGRKAHDLTESAYRNHGSTRGEPGWTEKQRILLADVALHLLQTALRDGELSTDELKQNLYSILTVSDQFIPDSGLKKRAPIEAAGSDPAIGNIQTVHSPRGY